MKTILLLIGVLLLTGCVSYAKTLVNDTGDRQSCSANGWGFIGAPYAAHTFDRCIENLHKRGYR